MEQKLVVEAKGLTKRFEDHLAVNAVNFEVYQGECFGILGPQGSGKSTLMRMMYGSSSVQGGELYIAGLNARNHIREIKSRIGVLPQDEGLDSEFTVRENLQLYGGYYGIPREMATNRAEELLKLMRLEDLSDQFIHVLNASMKRRLGIARAMINKPELLLLDEPSAGMDAQARQWVWNFLNTIKSEMGTVILTTHFMEEAQQICDRVAIMDHGHILAVGRPMDLIRENIGVQVIEFQIERHELQYYLTRLGSEKYRYQVIRDQVNVHLQSQNDIQKVMGLVQSFKVTIRQPTLSDVFLKLAGYNLKDDFI